MSTQEISQLVRQEDYRVDPDAVARAILVRIGGRRALRSFPSGSEGMLVAHELEALARGVDA